MEVTIWSQSECGGWDFTGRLILGYLTFNISDNNCSQYVFYDTVVLCILYNIICIICNLWSLLRRDLRHPAFYEYWPFWCKERIALKTGLKLKSIVLKIQLNIYSHWLSTEGYTTPTVQFNSIVIMNRNDWDVQRVLCSIKSTQEYRRSHSISPRNFRYCYSSTVSHFPVGRICFWEVDPCRSLLEDFRASCLISLWALLNTPEVCFWQTGQWESSFICCKAQSWQK